METVLIILAVVAVVIFIFGAMVALGAGYTSKRGEQRAYVQRVMQAVEARGELDRINRDW